MTPDPLANALEMDHERMCAPLEVGNAYTLMCHLCRMSWPFLFANRESAELLKRWHLEGII